jgi:hypothetical protein
MFAGKKHRLLKQNTAASIELFEEAYALFSLAVP